jgi:hypothetical protein
MEATLFIICIVVQMFLIWIGYYFRGPYPFIFSALIGLLTFVAVMQDNMTLQYVSGGVVLILDINKLVLLVPLVLTVLSLMDVAGLRAK